jgi:ABC-2 type transport system ATP-binding protein
MLELVVDIRNLVKRFKGVAAVNGLNLQVTKGEVVGLVGADGAGKTTTMRMLCGLSDPDSGDIRVLGCKIPGQEKAARAQIGYMPQQYSLYGDLSVQENLRFFAGMYGVKKRDMLEREKRLLNIARLEPFRDRPAGKLSGGMYKKLALSCALIHQPRLLLLDEPTNGVDPISRRELWAFLYELVGEGVSVMVSTPYMDEAERCDRVALIHQGRIADMDSPANLRARFDETVFELETNPFTDAAALFAGAPGISQVYMVGKLAHLITPKGPDFAAQIRKRVEEEAKVRVVRLEAVSPSFEDIFFHATSHSAARSAVEAHS